MARLLRTRCASLAVAALLSALGCGGDAGPRLVFLTDLAEEQGAGFEAVQVSGEERPILSFGHAEGVFTVARGEDVTSSAPVLDVPLVFPPGTPPGAAFRLQALIVAGTKPRVSTPELVRGERMLARLTLVPEETGVPLRYQVSATVLPLPGARARTVGPLAIPSGAELALGLAIPGEHCADHPDAVVRVDLVQGRQSRALWRGRFAAAVLCGRWREVTVPLGAASGRSVALRFRVRAARARERERALHVVLGDPLLRRVKTRPPSPSRPSLILVSLDTLAARHVGAYGYPYPTTPRLDAFAAGGVLFARALSHYPATPASHMTMLTGLLPATHGVRSVGDQLPADVPTLAERLRRSGYMTAAVTEGGALQRAMGFGRGFHAYSENEMSPRRADLARATFRRAAHWLESASPEPFFLFLHTYEVHVPYQPRDIYIRRVRPAGVPPKPTGYRYDGEVRFLDGVVGLFLRRLDRAGLLGHTVVVITADHGEAFGEHGATQHGSMLYDEVMRVPLIVRGPGVARGLRVEQLVGLVDVTPTLLELAGIGRPEGMEGRSLVPLLRGGTRTPAPVIAELRGTVVGPGGSDAPNLRAVWLDDHKLIYDVARDAWQVFDLARDPKEEHDLAASSAPLIADAGRLLAAYDGAERARAAGARPGGGAAVTPEAIERLRALGYVE